MRNVRNAPPFNPLLFPVFFVGMWIGVGLLLSWMTGWISLMKIYPDRTEAPTETISIRSCSMGAGVHCRGVISAEVCESGLRLKMSRFFGPFCKPLFFPWGELAIERKQNRWTGERAVIHFGNPPAGRLAVGNHVADHLARLVGGRWPETGTFTPETADESFRAVLKSCSISALVVMAFIVIVPRIAGAPTQARPPLAVAILFPSVVFGLVGVYEYFSRRKHAK